jgi:hypothetical protein
MGFTRLENVPSVRWMIQTTILLQQYLIRKHVHVRVTNAGYTNAQDATSENKYNPTQDKLRSRIIADPRSPAGCLSFVHDPCLRPTMTDQDLWTNRS